MIALPLKLYLNRGLNSWNTVNDPSGVDDVQLVRDIIDSLSQRLFIDPKRIYATGHGMKDVVNSYTLTDYSPPYWTAGVEESIAGWVDKNGCSDGFGIFSRRTLCPNLCFAKDGLV